MEPTVSVIIPTFNRAALVTRAIESVLAQTRGDCELIVVDDGSTDNTAQVVRVYGSRVRYLYQSNRGASAARNVGLRLASGDVIGFLDSDDVWAPAKIQRQMEALDAMGADFGACLTDCVISDKAGGRASAFDRAALRVSLPYGELDDRFKYILQRRPAIWIQSLLVRRGVLDEVGGFDESLATTEDTDFIFRLALRTRLCYVSLLSVTIDVDRQHCHLTDFHRTRSADLHARNVYRYSKWLHLAAGNAAVQNIVREHLRDEYYEWAITNIHGFSLRQALQQVLEITRLGDSPTVVCGKLAHRAAAKLVRSARP